MSFDQVGVGNAINNTVNMWYIYSSLYVRQKLMSSFSFSVYDSLSLWKLAWYRLFVRWQRNRTSDAVFLWNSNLKERDANVLSDAVFSWAIIVFCNVSFISNFRLKTCTSKILVKNFSSYNSSYCLSSLAYSSRRYTKQRPYSDSVRLSLSMLLSCKVLNRLSEWVEFNVPLDE